MEDNFVGFDAQHWDTNTKQFLRAHLSTSPNDHLRIATGFFTVAGQEALRSGFETTAWILVGFDENAAESEVENITKVIQRELETTHTLTYEVIRHLADELSERVRVVQTRYRRGDHAKVIIYGSRAAFLGSPNLTIGGMNRNTESLHYENDSNEVIGWVTAFDQKWHDDHRNRDVTEEIRALLLEALKFASPFDAYLAACHAILDERVPVHTRDDYIEPLPYQTVVARRAAASISHNSERGHWIIASTGLGKTVMATHVALLLYEHRHVREVIVIAPARTQEEWKRRMRSARLSAEVFSTSILRRDPEGKDQIRSRQLQREFDAATKETLLIIDESHEFRNRYNDIEGEVQERIFASRLEFVTQNRGARVLLLTATPYAKSLQGINNQLLLLPHTANDSGTKAHSIQSIEEIYRVPVVTALSYNTVREQFAQRDHTGTFVTFQDDSRGYIQTLQLERVEFTPLAAEPVMRNLSVFAHDLHHRTDAETREKTSDASSVMRQMVESLTSSPVELKRKLESELARPSGVTFRFPKQERVAAIKEILTHLKGNVAARDEKLSKLLEVLGEARKTQEKTLVFVARKETGQYLKEQFLKVGLRAAFLSGSDPNAESIIAGFAPHANKESPQVGEAIDMLIATDTVAAGVNLQDATLVVHYDAPWTADIFNQRNGRITRFRKQPTVIRSLLFTAKENLKKLETLESRLESAAVFGNIDQIETAIRHGKIEGEVLRAEAERRSSDVLSDFATLEQHQERARGLRNGRITARYADTDYLTTISIVRVEGVSDATCIQTVHGSEGEKTHTLGDAEALKAFRCQEDEGIAVVPFPLVDGLVKRAMINFVESHSLPEDSVTHIASVTLVPNEYSKHLTLN